MPERKVRYLLGLALATLFAATAGTPNGIAQMRPTAPHSTCSWGLSIRLCGSHEKGDCHGWRAITPDERAGYQNICGELLPLVRAQSVPYLLHFQCRRFHDGLFACNGVLLPRTTGGNGQFLPVRLFIRPRVTRSFQKSLDELRDAFRSRLR